MKTILACLLVLVISVTLSNAACFLQPLNPGTPDDEIKGCRDSNGELHEFGSHWRNADCYDCFCSRIGMSCCFSFPVAVAYDEEKCVNILDKETCAYKVVDKDDHSKECPVTGVTDK